MRNRCWIPILAVVVLLAPAFAQQAERLAPYVPSPQTVVERMLEIADLKPGETVYDLGCGDGRILFTAAREFRAKAVGVELSDPLVKQGREQAKRLGLENRVTIIQGDLLRADLRPADVVTVYLLTEANDKLKPLFERSLHPGARVVSHDFKIRGWRPDRVDEVVVSGRAHKIYVYVIPPHKG
ncbi:MAG: methyltransferase domain-containing protein [Bryobacteraceae bacterium]|jgi:ubiquinone/menaquinone biosynthesis C-methylase UbiE